MTCRLYNLLTVLSLLPCASICGCHTDPRPDHQRSSPPAATHQDEDPPATSASPSTIPAAQAVPVVYVAKPSRGIFGFFFPPETSEPLTPEQTAAVLDAAARAVPGGTPWFVLARSGDTDPVRGLPLFDVYFVPDQSTPRLRKGWYCMITQSARGVVGDAWRAPYVQVSGPGTTFGPGRQIPAVADLPFSVPRNADGETPAFDDEELVAIADAARTGARKNIRRDRWNDVSISSIDDRGDRIDVYFRGPGDGGPMVFLSRAHGTFTYTRSGLWRP